jgi:peptidoglycan/xylan/chitin deacetylase (PgdA/CDA1 family)
MKDSIKRLIGQAIFASNLDALLLRNAAMVVTFHRVRDTRTPEGLTVSVRMFEEYCRFFKRHFTVVSLGELVGKLERGATLNRELAITFDDGYEDNFENAAPVLEKLGLPATFFIVTQWMGTDVVPWWDKQQGVRHPWMTWEQVRTLQQRGFEVGAHTRTHVDLGSVNAVEASEEIAGARRELEQHLGVPVDLFAYPYGRLANLADANRRLVRGAGFRCCCSCFGGVIAAGTDPFHLRRVPISSRYHSPFQFGFEVALGRSVQSADAGLSVPILRAHRAA